MDDFSLLIKPASARCNLQCTYCFYSDKSDVFPDGTFFMTEPILEKLIRSYQQLPFASNQYTYAWQGGEPTLAGLGFYRTVVTFQQKYGRNGMGVSNALQTNGFLLDDEWAAFLAEYHFLTGISIDGPAAIHDHFRRDRSDAPTHARIMKSCEAMNRNKADFNVLCLVSQSNVRCAREIFEFYRDNGMNWLQFIPCVEVQPDGTRYPFAISDEECGTFLCELFDIWYPHRRTVSVRLFDALLAYMAFEESVICHIGTDCRRYFVIEHNGDVFPCDFFVRPEYRLGSIMTDSFYDLKLSPVYRDFGCQKLHYAPKCRHCKYVALCAGDCLKHRLLPPHPAPENKSHLCAGLLRFFDHAVPRLKKLALEIRKSREPSY